jgi:putative IMPACT (imprinted ancient) family translation regulator
MRAYGNTAKLLLEAAQISPFIPQEIWKLSLPHSIYALLQNRLSLFGGKILDQSFGDQIECIVSVPENTFTMFIESIGSQAQQIKAKRDSSPRSK